MNIAYYVAFTFRNLKVQSFILTKVNDFGLLIVVTSFPFLKRKKGSQTCIHKHIYMYIHAYAYTYTYACIYKQICMFVHIYAYTYTHAHTQHLHMHACKRAWNNGAAATA